MMKLMLYVAGALEVPPCFSPSVEYAAAAQELGYQVLVIGLEHVASPPEEVLIEGLAVDEAIMETIASS
jgi:hypothetical protein